MTNTIKAIIIDDEQLGRDLIKSYLKEFSFIELTEECADGFQGMKAIQELKPDIIFLDVQMPKITGFEMLELIDNPPIVIFTTAYNEYAIKAFEMNAVDYLLKPFSKERFKQAIEKAVEKHKHKETDQVKIQALVNAHPASVLLERVVLKTGTKIKIIPIHEILYLEAQDDYVMLYTSEGKYLKQQTMKYFETHLDNTKFVRIHRSYIANIQEIVHIEPYEKESYRVVLKNKTFLPISKSGYSLLKKILNF